MALVGGENIGVQSTPGPSMLMKVRTHSWSTSRLYRPQGSFARSSGATWSLAASPLKMPASALPTPTTMPMIQPAIGIAETAFKAMSTATLAMAPSSLAGSPVNANGTSASKPAMASVLGLIHATLPQTLPSMSPLRVAFFFQRSWVAWFQASAPAWLRRASPTVLPDPP